MSSLFPPWRRIGVTACRRYSATNKRETKTAPNAQDYQNRLAEPIRPKRKSHDIDSDEFFVDFKRVALKAGDGGAGLASFRHVKYVPFAGPGGGDGGNGGHVILEGDSGVKGFNHLGDSYQADPGGSGMSEMRHGASAEHLVLKVPLGTTLIDPDSGKMVDEISTHGHRILGARGGAGGHGNHYYATPTNTAPDYAEPGGQGETREYNLDLRIIAHAGFVGFPNVGKSSLLRAISRARPKVAAYPFTTVKPFVGIVDYDDHVRLAFADLPGILPGFHDNTDFLRYVHKCICLVYVIDLSMPEPWRQLDQLKSELELFEPGLSQRPNALVASKADLSDLETRLSELKSRVDPLPVFPISSKRGTGIRDLLLYLRRIYDENWVPWFDSGKEGTY